ncbi:MAG: 3-methyl-2-oxobutanoate hydroxymethyltransferase, partial [Burkholderiaceae bacterium]
IADMPFSTFQESPEKTFYHAAKLMDAGAQMVKLEGGGWLLETIEFLTVRGIPVCTHLGMLPQSIHKIGCYRKFGSSEQEKDLLVKTANSLESAGSELLILELVNSSTSKQITEVLKIPTVGIGSGKFVDGQVLVLYDILGIGNKLSFAKNFLSESNSIEECVKNYIHAVKKGTFPEN